WPRAPRTMSSQASQPGPITSTSASGGRSSSQAAAADKRLAAAAVTSKRAEPRIPPGSPSAITILIAQRSSTRKRAVDCREAPCYESRMRVVSLLPAATEIVTALGAIDQLVGVSHECDHPPAVNDLPRITHCAIHGNALPSAEIDRWVKTE